MRFRINWRFILILTATVAVCLTAIHFVHRWQVRRQVGVFLHQADVARDATPPDTPREIAYLRRYLAARPDENDVRERLGRRMAATAKTRNETLQAYLVIEETLRRDPDRNELRRFSIDFAMKAGLPSEQALSNIEILLAKQPNDGELHHLKARCLARAKKYGEAEMEYAKAVTHRPDLVDAYIERAAILRMELNRPSEADGVVAQMLEANPNNFRTYLLLTAYWREFGRLDQRANAVAKVVAEKQRELTKEREQKLQDEATVRDAIAQATGKAQKLAPEELDVILAAADVARFRSYALAREAKADEAKSALAEAHRILKEGAAKHPKAPAIYLALAALEAESKQEQEPVAVIRAGLEAVPESPELVIALLDYQIRAGDAPGAQETLEQLKGRGLAPAQAELQQGRILMLKGEWIEAANALDHVRRTNPDNQTLTRQANLFLGRCYEQLGLRDRRREAFRQAVPADTTDPLWVPALLGLAEAEAALGKTDESLQVYEQLRGRGLGGAWLPIARIEVFKALQLPAEKRDWKAAEAAVQAAERVLKDNTEARILRAALLGLRGDGAEARKRLEALKAEHPKDVAVWVALAAQDQRDGNPDQALATLDAAEKQVGDSAALRLARGRVWVESKAPDLDQKLEGLVADADKLPPADRRALVRGAAELAAGALAVRLWDRVAELQPYDLGVHLTRFDLALRSDADNEAKAKKLAAVHADIKRVDGEAGQSTQFSEAAILLWRAQNLKDMAGLDRASALLAELERERPTWARVAFAQGLVHDLRGETRLALGKYQNAASLGESSPAALRRLMELLRATGKFDEAAAVLQKLPKSAIGDVGTQRIAADVALRTNNLSEAEAYADKAVPEGSTNPTEYIWQGQVYFHSGAKAKAEAAFRKAATLRPEEEEGWLVLIQYLVATNRRPEAEKVLEDAKEKVAKADRSLFLGAANALVGKVDEAAAAFKLAREERPGDLRTLRAEAEFLFQTGRLDQAGEAFGRVLELQTATPDEKRFAREMIALTLAADQDYTKSREALQKLGLLEGDRLRPLTGNESPAERRSRVLVLALQRDRDSRMEAIKMIEEDRKAGREVSPADQFLLAQLYQGIGDRGQVRVVMAGLLQKNDRVALYVRFYAAWLLRIGDHQEAEKWVKRLAELQPDSLATAELRARLAVAQGNLAAARAAIVPRADRPDAPVLGIARLCEALKLYADAEALYKRAVEKLKDKEPQAPLVLAGFYGRRGRTAEALRICDEMRKTIAVETVGAVAVAVLYESPAPTAAQMDHVAGWLDEARGKAAGPVKAALTQFLASIRNLQGDYDAAMTLYRDAITANPRDALAMNNLAYLVSTSKGQHQEALRLLETARRIRGPLHELLDTEALVRLNMGDAEGARRLLETVTAEAPSASAFFHLARAELAATKPPGRRLEALRAWQQAQERGIKPADLHPLERREFERVSALLK